jgi:uncharacterized protein
LKASRYNVWAYDKRGGLLLYNTLYGSVTHFAAEEVCELEQALEDPDGAASTFLDGLMTQRHIIDDDDDELSIVTERRRRGISGQGRLDVVVMPTLDCNFDCAYCYEQREAGSRMSADVERRLVSWLVREIPSAVMLMLHWFGGEPLYDVPLIVRVTNRCREVGAVHGTHIAPHVTTNGYLLDGWRRDQLLANGIKDFQVTIDGPAQTHDAMRPLRGGQPTFKRVFRNVIDTVRADPEVGMTLRVNVNHKNLDHVESLLAAFDADVRSRLRFVVEPIFGDGCVSATGNLPATRLASRMTDLYAEAARLGFEVSAANAGLLTGRLTYCYAERNRQIVVSHTGSVFKCAAGSFDEKDRLAQLTDDGRLLSHQGAWERWMSFGEAFAERCQACPYLPVCMGGCRKVSMQSDTDVCTLVPSNASYALKQISLAGFPNAVIERIAGPERMTKRG